MILGDSIYDRDIIEYISKCGYSINSVVEDNKAYAITIDMTGDSVVFNTDSYEIVSCDGSLICTKSQYGTIPKSFFINNRWVTEGGSFNRIICHTLIKDKEHHKDIVNKILNEVHATTSNKVENIEASLLEYRKYLKNMEEYIRKFLDNN